LRSTDRKALLAWPQWDGGKKAARPQPAARPLLVRRRRSGGYVSEFFCVHVRRDVGPVDYEAYLKAKLCHQWYNLLGPRLRRPPRAVNVEWRGEATTVASSRGQRAAKL